MKDQQQQGFENGSGNGSSNPKVTAPEQSGLQAQPAFQAASQVREALRAAYAKGVRAVGAELSQMPCPQWQATAAAALEYRDIALGAMLLQWPAGAWPVVLTEAQVRTLVRTAFKSGAEAISGQLGTADWSNLDDEQVQVECSDAEQVAVAAIEAGPWPTRPTAVEQPQGCAIVRGQAHEWEYGHSANGLHRKCAKCGCWDTQAAAGRACDA